MSSYHTSFQYNEKNSAQDYGLLISSFEPDNGFTDSFLSMENVSDNYFDGTKRFDYGSKYSTQAEIQITMIKRDGTDMTTHEFRTCAKWLTGARVNSWLDMYVGDTIVYSFLGKFINMEQYKMDARTIGFRVTFSSVSPWAYSQPQHFDCSIYQVINLDENGVLNKGDQFMGVFDGVLCASTDEGSYFNITDKGEVYLDTAYKSTITNESDDLYTYIYLDIDYVNESGTSLSIKNETLGEESVVTGMTANETVAISAKQFITSSKPNKIFGDNFNFVWPRLKPGDNHLIVSGDGRGAAYFTYRYPMKVGDNIMDIATYGNGIPYGDGAYDPSDKVVKWEDIVGIPTTLGGYGLEDEVDAKIENINIEWNDIENTPKTLAKYGITDAYTKNEINTALSNVSVKWENVENTPTTIEGYNITDAYTTSDVYTKTEVDDKIDNIEIPEGSGGGGGSTNIDEEALNSMLEDILG